MRLDGVWAQGEALGDVVVAQSGGDQREDLAFPGAAAFASGALLRRRSVTAATERAWEGLVLSWSTILYGVALSALGAAVLTALVRPRRPAVIAAAAVGAFAGPLAWNAILRATAADSFFIDAPIAVLPASWQDTGSGVFAVAATALVLGLGPLAAGTGRRVAALAGLAGLAAFLVDVYLY